MAITDLISPEVSNDSFYAALSVLGSYEDIKTVIEIGSSSGEGTTKALVESISVRPDAGMVKLFCMELSRPRFNKLVSNYSNLSFVKAYNLSSVALADFPSKDEVIYFYNNTNTKLNLTPLEVVMQWYDQDINYIKDNCLDINGIEIIKKANNITHFDFALIDGSEFTGESELHSLIGSKYIALDDVNSFKCFNAYQILENHISYECIERNLNLRNGFAIYKRNF